MRHYRHFASLASVDPANVDGDSISMVSVRDMGVAFGQQVVRPAIPDLNRIQAGLIAHGLLFPGRSVRRMLEMARDWHARQGAIDSAMQALPIPTASPGSDAWKAGFPDWRHDGVDIRVLTTPRELSAEGARGTDASGVAGLRHCVGTYAPACRRGKVRILGLRGKDPNGTVRLSTAEVSTTTGWRVKQHKGWRNGPPPEEAEAALQAYLEACRAGTLPVDLDGFSPVSGPGGTGDDAGYDVAAPGAVDAVFAAWTPLLPRTLRRAGLPGLPALAATVPTEDGRWWLPPADRRGMAGPPTGIDA